MNYLRHIYSLSLFFIIIIISKPLYADNQSLSDAKNACESNNIENFEKIIMPLVNDNNPNAQYFLALQYLKTSYCGKTVRPNYKESLNLLKKAALQKHISASSALSSLYNPKGHGRGKVRSDSLQSLKWAYLASSFNNEYAHIKPSDSDDWNSEKYQNAFQIEKQFNLNKTRIKGLISSAKKNLTEEQINIVDLHTGECLQNLSSCSEIIIANDENESTQITNNSQKLVCKIKMSKAIPCTKEKKIELEGRGINILERPMTCGKNVTTEFIDVIVNADNNSMKIDNVNVQICSGAPIKNKTVEFRQQCEPIEDDYYEADGFLQGKINYYSGPLKSGAIVGWEAQREKQLIQNLDSGLATRIIQPPSTIASSYGKCYPAEKKDYLVKEHQDYLKQKELDEIAEKKLQELKAKYADAPSCSDVPFMDKYKKKASKVNMDILTGNPPEPCKKRGEILLPKSMR